MDENDIREDADLDNLPPGFEEMALAHFLSMIITYRERFSEAIAHLEAANGDVNSESFNDGMRAALSVSQEIAHRYVSTMREMVAGEMDIPAAAAEYMEKRRRLN